MSEALADIIKDMIRANGPIDVGTFMALALGQPEHGYYMTRDPFGADGDFTTAPEISQVFGELVGAWLADMWMQMGAPASLTLVECGPGRGTLMADILRVTSNIEGFHEGLRVCLVEMSPALKARQKEALKDYDFVYWYEAIEGIPHEAPVLLIGNEFLDALPVRQVMRNDQGWQERVVALQGGDFCFVFQKADKDVLGFLPSKTQSNALYEVSPARLACIKACSVLIKHTGGAALFIDYGYIKRAAGDTLQALYAHDHSDILKNIGQSDLTAHVDFEALTENAQAQGVQIFGLESQGGFLQSLGALHRARALMAAAKGDKKRTKDIEAGVHRLIAPSEMGNLFKVMGFGYGYDFKPSGF